MCRRDFKTLKDVNIMRWREGRISTKAGAQFPPSWLVRRGARRGRSRTLKSDNTTRLIAQARVAKLIPWWVFSLLWVIWGHVARWYVGINGRVGVGGTGERFSSNFVSHVGRMMSADANITLDRRVTSLKF